MNNTDWDKHNIISRRDFIKDSSMIIGGAMLASSTLTSSCKTTNTSSDTSTTSEQFYIINNQGSTSKVALDRLYSDTHIWVKNLGDNVVQIGVTDKFQKLMGNSIECSLSLPGTIINIGESFGAVGARKFNADLISPVSGKVIETNQDLMVFPAVERINFDPYFNGWMLKVKLSKPAELDELLSPMYYAYLQTQNWIGTVPEMH